jgi:hypothetical protein
MHLLKSRKFQLVFAALLGIASGIASGEIEPMAALYSGVVLVIALIVTIAWEDVSKRGAVFGEAQRMTDLMKELLYDIEVEAGNIEGDEEPQG